MAQNVKYISTDSTDIDAIISIVKKEHDEEPEIPKLVVLPEYLFKETKIIINPDGSFEYERERKEKETFEHETVGKSLQRLKKLAGETNSTILFSNWGGKKVPSGKRLYNALFKITPNSIDALRQKLTWPKGEPLSNFSPIEISAGKASLTVLPIICAETVLPPTYDKTMPPVTRIKKILEDHGNLRPSDLVVFIAEGGRRDFHTRIHEFVEKGILKHDGHFLSANRDRKPPSDDNIWSAKQEVVGKRLEHKGVSYRVHTITK